MSGNEFVIEELATITGTTPPNNKYEKFIWTAKNKNIPASPWSFGVEQRTIRTDYPGGDSPTEQVLGPHFTVFTLAGRWDDRYNATPLNENTDRDIIDNKDGASAKAKQGGYAVREWQRFEEMVRRGNQVLIYFEDVIVQGIITSFHVDYRRDWDIGYSFTVSPHHRTPQGFFALSRSPRRSLSAKQLRNEVSVLVDEALAFHARAPQIRLVKTLYTDIDDQIAVWQSRLSEIDLAIEQRTLSFDTEKPVSLFKLAADFYSMATVGVTIIDFLETEDSGEALDFEQGVQTLNYDVWSRGLMDVSRRMIVAGQRAAADLQQRAEPNATKLYEARAGESLYAISNLFYRTPRNWRIIATRNKLTSLVLTGDELLIIPDVVGR